MDDRMGAFVIFRPATSVPSIVFPPSWRAGDVRVWPADLDGWKWNGEDPDGLLSADERTRAARFVFEKDRRRFVTGRAVLRTILGRCLGRPAALLSFRYGPQGKPMVADGDLWFNASASGGKALYALSLNRRVGVDIERVRDVAGMTAVADRAFSATEREMLRVRRGARRRSEFFRCWTRKEAIAKGLGRGLSMPLDGFDVRPFVRGLVQVDTGSAVQDGGPWAVRDVTVFRGFAAAVAVETPGVGHKTYCLGEERA